MDLIDIKNLSVAYGKNTVLNDLSLGIEKNKITSIVGPSGCGKSTFLTVLNGMINDYEGSYTGEVLFKGKDIKEYKVENLRSMIGMVFQKPTPFPMSIYKNIVYGPKYYGVNLKADLDRIVEENLKKVGLYDEINEQLSMSALKLSGGQQQRLCIARTLSIEPEVLLLDEPCSALDVKNTAIIEKLLKDLSNDYTIIIVTHNLAQARRISDHTAFILNGELIEYGDTEDVFSNPKDSRTKEYLDGIYG